MKPIVIVKKEWCEIVWLFDKSWQNKFRDNINNSPSFIDTTIEKYKRLKTLDFQRRSDCYKRSLPDTSTSRFYSFPRKWSVIEILSSSPLSALIDLLLDTGLSPTNYSFRPRIPPTPDDFGFSSGCPNVTSDIFLLSNRVTIVEVVVVYS